MNASGNKRNFLPPPPPFFFDPTIVFLKTCLFVNVPQWTQFSNLTLTYNQLTCRIICFISVHTLNWLNPPSSLSGYVIMIHFLWTPFSFVTKIWIKFPFGGPPTPHPPPTPPHAFFNQYSAKPSLVVHQIIQTHGLDAITELCQKSRIRETMNLSTDADHRTNIFFWGGMVKKK